MNNDAKKLYEKTVDYQRFAIMLLTVGAFFFLGVIIPSAANSLLDQYIMIAASMLFLCGSILFFISARKAKRKLIDHEENKYLQ
jgi:VIT1/CCC1 family predicted Fe2+/Mn2+ transporter